MFRRERHPGKPGFRFSRGDAVAILVCALATWLAWAWTPMGSLALIFPITVGHFFLFCNVFRIRPTYELIWTGVYLANMLYWLLFGQFRWLAVLTVQTPLTIALIVLELRSPRYHGVFNRKVRPQSGRERSPV